MPFLLAFGHAQGIAAHLLMTLAPARHSTRSFRPVPHFEAHPKVVGLARTTAGKLLLLAIFSVTTGGMDGFSRLWLVTTGLLTAITFAPAARWPLVLVGTLAVSAASWLDKGVTARVVEGTAVRVMAPQVPQMSRPAEAAWVILPLVLIFAGLMWSARAHPKGVVARRPLTTILGIEVGLLALACALPMEGVGRYVVWPLLLGFTRFVWFLAYAVRDRAMAAGSAITRQFATFNPFWGGTMTPYTKGAAYWRRIESNTPDELAVTMVKGTKLILWALLLLILANGQAWAFRTLEIPSLNSSMNATSAGRSFPLGMTWISLVGGMLSGLLWFSVKGHVIIATCRMAGFRALRNTYAPLSSRTIAEYFNRYYFYFKELLVDMFFYPAFLAYFKGYPRVRVFFATFAAVVGGSTIYHFLYRIRVVATEGLVAAIESYPYLWYSLILAFAISVSQIRRRPAPETRSWLHQRILAPGCVVAFFCVLGVFDTGSYTLETRLRFVWYLFSGR